MRLPAVALFFLAAGAVAVVTACGSRTSLDEDPTINDAGFFDQIAHDATKPPVPDTGPDSPYVPLAARCARDGGAPPTFVPDLDASFDAAHPRAPQVVTSGGPVVALPTLVAVTFPGDELANQEEDFIDSVGCTDYWSAVASDYGVGQAVAGPPVRLTESAPADIDDGAIQSWLDDKVTNDKAFPQPDANTVFVIFYPAGTRVTLYGSQSCQSFDGYHNSVHTASRNVPYAVIPRCGSSGTLTGIDAVTSVTSHELLEAATDPVPGKNPAYARPEPQGWGFAIAAGGEVGDMCEFKTDAFFLSSPYPFYVQRTWSNKAAFQFGDPCVPAAAGPFFAAAPRFTGTINVDIGLGPQQVMGVTVPLGQTVTIDVVAFSNGSVPSWKLSGVDAMQLRGGASELGMSFDKIIVTDGDVAHVKILREKNPQAGASAFAIISTNGTRQAYWWGMAN